MAAADDDAGYVCGLDAETERKALKELNEDPKDRLGAVQTLRTWIQQQPHLTFKTDTRTLLAFLRTAKFSQLKAREIIENNARAVTMNPRWMQNIDTLDPAIQEVIDSGYVLPLPKKDKNGSQLVLYRMGAMKKNGEMLTVAGQIRAAMVVGWFVGMDEMVQVNGFSMICDLSGMTTRHMTIWSLDDIKKWNSCWQSAMPGRFKAFHYCNSGALFETMMAVVRPILSKKMQERIRVHDTLESLYKYVSMELLPTEYLPDEYDGPSIGSIATITENFKRAIMAPEVRTQMLENTSDRVCKLDEKKRPNYKVVNESFRKLAVD